MPLYPSWWDIALRLGFTLLAGALLGANREARGQAAGLRTTMLVGLAAAVAAIQMNLLLPVAGKTGASFSVMDVARLPLGILSGIGFIGAGAILRRGELVVGVTTAATLWTITVIGLCFGGGQIALGVLATVLAAAILWWLKALDRRFTRVHRARLRMTVAPGTDITAFSRELLPGPYRCSLADVTDEQARILLIYDVKWHQAHGETPLALIAELRARPGVGSVSWVTMTKFD